MLDDDIQQELLRDTVDPERALSIAVNMEMGHQNQQRVASNNNNKNSNAINAIQSFNRFRGANTRINQSGRNSFNRAANGQFRGCGQNRNSTRLQVRPALGKKCNHCGLLNHFAKVCRKKNDTKKSRQNTRINNIENSETTEQSESQNVNFINYNEHYNSECKHITVCKHKGQKKTTRT